MGVDGGIRWRTVPETQALSTLDGLVELRSGGSGGLMGCSSEIPFFMHHFYEPVRQWNMQNHGLVSKPLIRRSSIFEEFGPQDSSLTETYVLQFSKLLLWQLLEVNAS